MSISSTSDSETPLMALVDVASTIYDSSEESSKHSVTDSEDSSKFPKIQRVTPPNSMGKLSFAELLMTALDDESHPFLTWMPDGKSFTIRNTKAFTTELMPKLFNIRNMSSFVRKLSRWGFQRYHEKETMNSDLFRHKDFQRGNWKACSEMKCNGRHPVTSLLRRPSSGGKSVSSIESAASSATKQKIPKSVTTTDQAKSPQDVRNLPTEAALKSLVQKEIMQALSGPDFNSKLLAVQLMSQALYQQQQEELSQRALLRQMLGYYTVDLNCYRLFGGL